MAVFSKLVQKLIGASPDGKVSIDIGELTLKVKGSFELYGGGQLIATWGIPEHPPLRRDETLTIEVGENSIFVLKAELPHSNKITVEVTS